MGAPACLLVEGGGDGWMATTVVRGGEAGGEPVTAGDLDLALDLLGLLVGVDAPVI